MGLKSYPTRGTKIILTKWEEAEIFKLPGAPPSESIVSRFRPLVGTVPLGAPWLPPPPATEAPASGRRREHGVISVQFTQHCKPISPPRGDTSASLFDSGSRSLPHLHICKGSLTIPYISRFAQGIRIL